MTVNETKLLSVLNEILNDESDQKVMMTGAVVLCTFVDEEGLSREVFLSSGLAMYQQRGLMEQYRQELELVFDHWWHHHNSEGTEE